MAGLVLRDLRHPADGSRLDVAELRLEAGERLVVFGPNGAGKSTLLRLLAGVLPGGAAIDAAYLPQQPYLFRGSAGWNLELGLDASQGAEARRLAERLGVAGVLAQPARVLSGGERQRVALARILARPEPWLLLDEPLAALDAQDRMHVARLLVEALGARGAVMVTHDREEAAALGAAVAVLVDGHILQQGPVETVFALPADEAVARAVGVANVIAGRITITEGPLAAVDAGPIPVWGLGEGELGSRARALFGAEAVTVYPGDQMAAGSARNRWTGRVAELRESGRLIEVLVDVGVRVVALVTPGAQEALSLSEGDSVAVAVKATAVKVIPG